MAFDVIPAIDIRGGKCVRLYQGDFGKETVFSNDPVGVARRWAEEGAQRIHVVDLDGAAEGKPVNSAVIRDIVRAVAVPVQVGGGLRTIGAIDAVVELGVARFVLGTAAIEDPHLVERSVGKHGDKVIAGIDARAGLAATHGWKTQQQVTVLDLANRMAAMGVGRIVYTDIAHDGVLAGPNFQAYEELLNQTSIKVIASGGVATIDHLARLATMGVEGSIIGRALYTGDIDLNAALAVARGL